MFNDLTPLSSICGLQKGLGQVTYSNSHRLRAWTKIDKKKIEEGQVAAKEKWVFSLKSRFVELYFFLFLGRGGHFVSWPYWENVNKKNHR